MRCLRAATGFEGGFLTSPNRIQYANNGRWDCSDHLEGTQATGVRCTLIANVALEPTADRWRAQEPIRDRLAWTRDV